MSVIGSNILAGAAGQGGGYVIKESLRFNESQSSYLSRTDGAATSAQIFTFSAWVKRGTITSAAQQVIFGGGNGTADYDSRLVFGSDDDLAIIDVNAAVSTTMRKTTAVYRDVSAWYHIVMAFDTTQATGGDRLKLYVNGVEVTSFSTSNNPALNLNLRFNSANGGNKTIGRKTASGVQYFDGYITEVNFIDGQALTPSSFGDYNEDTGVWQPVDYAGTYGNNGFYLPMQLDNTVAGFNTVTWVGNGSTQKISGVGFQPDLVWIKERSSTSSHMLTDAVRGIGGGRLETNNTDEEKPSVLTSFDADGFSMTINDGTNQSGETYVGWCWDAGDTTVSNTDGSITSSVRADPAYGFSVVTYTGAGSAGTVGHGLNSTPDLFVVKSRDTTGDWLVLTTLIDGSVDRLTLNDSVQSSDSTTDAPTASVFNIKGSYVTNNEDYLAYCFTSIAGYSKISTYTGTGATGNAITTGFKPAFVMIKRTDSTGSWSLFDNTRDPVNPIDVRFLANTSDEENSASTIEINFNADGFEIDGTADSINASGGTFIYMAFKDTREYAFWLDDSGNNNDWQPNGGITTGSTVTDTPTPYLDGGNYAVLNPLATNAGFAISDANLTYSESGAPNECRPSPATIAISSGKWYWEVNTTLVGGGTYSTIIGIRDATITDTTETKNRINGYGYATGGDKLTASAVASYGSSMSNGDVVGIAYDADAGEIEFFLNNTSQGVAFTGITGSYFPVVAFSTSTTSHSISGSINFGQRPFAYTPPTGFKTLHTGNLPDVAIENGSEYFNAVLYTGDGTNGRSVTTEFKPDFIWIKNRSAATDNILGNSMILSNGEPILLSSNLTNAEFANGYIGNVSQWSNTNFTVNGDTRTNANGSTYVAWNWKAGGAAVTNTAGSITSQVSASPTAGFSVVTFTGNASGSATVGHGLGTAPSMVIVKRRDVADGWPLYHSSLGVSKLLELHSTSGEQTSSNYWGSAITSTTFGLSAGGSNNRSGSSNVAYCFSEVLGYSSFGSYVGNGNSDGVFVNLGFRPAFVMVKQSNASGRNWSIWDGKRDTSNVVTNRLLPNGTNADVVADDLDFLSNGFKIRRTGGDFNASGGTYIYMAFAENPFKNSLAR